MSDDTTVTRPGAAGAPADDQVVAEQVQAPGETRVPPRGGIRETLFRRPGSREATPATQAVHTELASVNATTVLLDRSGSEQITAEQVTMERSGARTINAQSAQLDRSGVVALGSDNAVLTHSSAVQVVAEHARLTDSTAVFVSAEKATLENTRVVLFAGAADGDVTAVVTPRSAALLVGGLACVVMLIGLLRGRSRA